MKCLNCGIEIALNKKYCSRKCRDKYYYKTNEEFRMRRLEYAKMWSKLNRKRKNDTQRKNYYKRIADPEYKKRLFGLMKINSIKWIRKEREERNIKGLCLRCGGERDDTKYKNCSKCRSKMREYKKNETKTQNAM